MNWQKTFIAGAVATALSSVACVVYAELYKNAFFVDFSQVVSIGSMISASAVGCFLMFVGYKLSSKVKVRNTAGWLNILYGVISFASIAGVLGFNLPLEVEFPEMFPGMVIPMHFFPLIAVLTIQPFFLFQQHKS